MVKIRLRRPGKSIKGRTHQKIVVTEKSWARESKFIDQIGYYDPGRDLLKIDTDKYKQWIEKGAQPSDTVASLFKNYGKPKKAKKKKTFRPGEIQDYPKSTKPDTEEQKEEAATTETATTEAQKDKEAQKKAVTTEAPKDTETPKEAATTETRKDKETEKKSEKKDKDKEEDKLK